MVTDAELDAAAKRVAVAALHSTAEGMFESIYVVALAELERAVAEEREACALLVERFDEAAAAIRARGQR